MKVGDLVMVVKPTPCCGRADEVGSRIFVVSAVFNCDFSCRLCGKRGNADFAGWGEGFNKGRRISRLRVIPPLNELEAEKAVETVNA